MFLFGFFYSIVKKDGSLELKRKFPIKHHSQLAMIRSSFCPIMSFRQGACIGNLLYSLIPVKINLFVNIYWWLEFCYIQNKKNAAYRLLLNHQ